MVRKDANILGKWVAGRCCRCGLDNTLQPCKKATLGGHGKPEIFNTDQGSQFTGSAFTGVLANKGIAIRMDGKGS